MRWIVVLAFCLLAAGRLAVEVELPNPAPPAKAAVTAWVRTADGWQKSPRDPAAPVYAPPLHPLVIAAGQLMLSVAALLAFPASRR